MVERIVLFACLSQLVVFSTAVAQTSSLGARQRRQLALQPLHAVARENPRIARNVVYDRHAWTAAGPKKTKIFGIGDLITVIVREQRSFEAESDLETKKKVSLDAQINEFIRLVDGGIGPTGFGRGPLRIDATLQSRLKNEGDAERRDRLTMRLTAKIIDIKPNGVLVLEGRARIQHDAEVSVLTVTGSCRKEDVTADNTILSTQLADKGITVDNQGALRDVTKRGWLFRMMDFLKPI